MKLKFTFLFKESEETCNTDEFIDNYVRTDIIPRILEIDGISHVDLCYFVPFEFPGVPPKTEQNHLLQMDIYYDSEEDFQKYLESFDSSYLVQELIKIMEYTDLYFANVHTYERSGEL